MQHTSFKICVPKSNELRSHQDIDHGGPIPWSYLVMAVLIDIVSWTGILLTFYLCIEDSFMSWINWCVKDDTVIYGGCLDYKKVYATVALFVNSYTFKTVTHLKLVEFKHDSKLRCQSKKWPHIPIQIDIYTAVCIGGNWCLVVYHEITRNTT